MYTYKPHAVAPSPNAVNAASVYEMRSLESEFAMPESMGLGPVFKALFDVFDDPLHVRLVIPFAVGLDWIECTEN